jgi:hypothetical protein
MVKQITLSKSAWLEYMKRSHVIADEETHAEASWPRFVAEIQQWYDWQRPSEYQVLASESATDDDFPNTATDKMLLSRAKQNVQSTIGIWGTKKSAPRRT